MSPTIARPRALAPCSALALAAVAITLLGLPARASAETSLFGNATIDLDFDYTTGDLVVDRVDDDLDPEDEYLFLWRNEQGEIRGARMLFSESAQVTTGESELWRDGNTVIPAPCDRVSNPLPGFFGLRGRLFADSVWCGDGLGRTLLFKFDPESPVSPEWSQMPMELYQDGDFTFETLPTAGGLIFNPALTSMGTAMGLPWLLLVGQSLEGDRVSAACKHEEGAGVDRILQVRLDIQATAEIVIEAEATFLNAPGEVGRIRTSDFSGDFGFSRSMIGLTAAYHNVAWDPTART